MEQIRPKEEEARTKERRQVNSRQTEADIYKPRTPLVEEYTNETVIWWNERISLYNVMITLWGKVFYKLSWLTGERLKSYTSLIKDFKHFAVSVFKLKLQLN